MPQNINQLAATQILAVVLVVVFAAALLSVFAGLVSTWIVRAWVRKRDNPTTWLEAQAWGRRNGLCADAARSYADWWERHRRAVPRPVPILRDAGGSDHSGRSHRAPYDAKARHPGDLSTEFGELRSS